MRFPTFSDAERAIVCPGSVALPQVGELNGDLKRGHGRHHFIRLSVLHGRDAALKEAPEEMRDEVAAIDLDGLRKAFAGCGLVRCEVAFALWRTPRGSLRARELGENIDRRYEEHGADRSREVCGTTDLFAVVMVGADEAVIVDVKGEWHPGNPWQLKFQALALARALGLRRVRVAFAHVVSGGGWRWDAVELWDDLDLAGIEAEVVDAMDRWREAHDAVASGRVPALTEGEHCRGCAAARFCPAKTALIRTAGAEVGEVVDPQRVVAATDEECARAWLFVKRFKPQLEALEEKLKERGALQPFEVGGGVRVGALPGAEFVDPAIGEAVLRHEFGDALTDKAVGRSLTKTSIEEAFGDRAPAALAAIRAAGGMKRGRPKVQEIGAPKRRGRKP